MFFWLKEKGNKGRAQGTQANRSPLLYLSIILPENRPKVNYVFLPQWLATKKARFYISKVRKIVLFNQIRYNVTSKSAIILERCLCIMTDSMTGWPATPAHAQHSTHGDDPQHAPEGQEGEGRTETRRHGHAPAPTAPAPQETPQH